MSINSSNLDHSHTNTLKKTTKGHKNHKRNNAVKLQVNPLQSLKKNFKQNSKRRAPKTGVPWYFFFYRVIAEFDKFKTDATLIPSINRLASKKRFQY